MGLSMKDRYVMHRIKGLGSREAAEAAGFAGGVPSPGARNAWRAVQLVKLTGCDAARADAMIKRHRTELRRALQIKRACQMLEDAM